jgi:DNA-binding CsgD family transcriptional regulator
VTPELLPKYSPTLPERREIQKRKSAPSEKGTALKTSEGESLMVSEQGLQNCARRTGTIMLTSSLRLIHMDPRANDLSRRIAAHAGPGGHGTLPPQVLELCAAVRRHGSFQVRAVTTNGAATEAQTIVLYAFAIPNPGREPSRILVLLRETRRDEWPIHLAVERFGLTPREEMVVRQLTLGYTNKEIANALRIAEQTVKEHMKHLMLKTGATTRTGLLARMFASSSGIAAAVSKGVVG